MRGEALGAVNAQDVCKNAAQVATEVNGTSDLIFLLSCVV